MPLAAPIVHGSTQVIGPDPLHVRTPPGSWQYAVSFPVCADPFRAVADAERGFTTVLDVETLTGRIGVGWAKHSGEFVDERYLDPGRTRVRLQLGPESRADQLVIRNADRADPSEFRVHTVETFARTAGRRSYQVQIAPRKVRSEPSPGDGGVVFEDDTARAINLARMAWLDGSGLPLTERRVLDVGCGPGHFARYYVERGCTVVGVDGREENIRELGVRLPQVQGHVGDVQRLALSALGRFDVVHCFGLLYHLGSPVAALREMHDACLDLLLLETLVCDSSRPLLLLVDEPISANQALDGIGCRPSPAHVAFALNRVGFPFVYRSTAPPQHPDFLFEWQDNLDIQRDGHNLRCVFVASRRPIVDVAFESLLDE